MVIPDISLVLLIASVITAKLPCGESGSSYVVIPNNFLFSMLFSMLLAMLLAMLSVMRFAMLSVMLFAMYYSLHYKPNKLLMWVHNNA
jgi:hypothetical protein